MHDGNVHLPSSPEGSGFIVMNHKPTLVFAALVRYFCIIGFSTRLDSILKPHTHLYGLVLSVS